MAFEDSHGAAAAISWERSLSLGSRLVRAHSAFQLESVKDYWENRQGYLRRRHAPRAGPRAPLPRDWLSSRPSEVADSTNRSYVGQELTANPIGTPYPDPLIRWYSFAHRSSFLSRHPGPLLRQSH
jgi:hypothetical protein